MDRDLLELEDEAREFTGYAEEARREYYAARREVDDFISAHVGQPVLIPQIKALHKLTAEVLKRHEAATQAEIARGARWDAYNRRLGEVTR